MFSSKKKTWLTTSATLLVLVFTSNVAQAKDPSLERFTRTVNLLNTEKDFSNLSQRMEKVAVALDKKGDVEKARNLRVATRPESLAMTRAYLRSELNKNDVNGVYLILQGPWFCSDNWLADSLTDMANCAIDIFLAIVTLGEKNVSASESL